MSIGNSGNLPYISLAIKVCMLCIFRLYMYAQGRPGSTLNPSDVAEIYILPKQEMKDKAEL